MNNTMTILTLGILCGLLNATSTTYSMNVAAATNQFSVYKHLKEDVYTAEIGDRFKSFVNIVYNKNLNTIIKDKQEIKKIHVASIENRNEQYQLENIVSIKSNDRTNQNNTIKPITVTKKLFETISPILSNNNISEYPVILVDNKNECAFLMKKLNHDLSTTTMTRPPSSSSPTKPESYTIVDNSKVTIYIANEFGNWLLTLNGNFEDCSTEKSNDSDNLTKATIEINGNWITLKCNTTPFLIYLTDLQMESIKNLPTGTSFKIVINGIGYSCELPDMINLSDDFASIGDDSIDTSHKTIDASDVQIYEVHKEGKAWLITSSDKKGSAQSAAEIFGDVDTKDAVIKENINNQSELIFQIQKNELVHLPIDENQLKAIEGFDQETSLGIVTNGTPYLFNLLSAEEATKEAAAPSSSTPRSNFGYYVAGGTFCLGLAGLIIAYFRFPELFKNLPIPNFLRLIPRGN